MSPLSTLAAFGATLAVVFGAAVGVGSAVGPVGTAAQDASGDEHGGMDMGTGPTDGSATARAALPGGLSASQDGYLLQLAQPVLQAGRATRFGLAVLGPDGEYLREYERSHDKELHLVVARRDLTGFQHVHPTRDEQGRWFVSLTLDEPGAYKVFADFVPGGEQDPVILAADVTVPGAYAPRPQRPNTGKASVPGGYDVALTGEIVAGTESELTLSVSRDGRPVTDLQPYLAAYGHLVALRASDLAYLHVHPDGEPGDGRTAAGPDVTFYADVPSTGTYGLFLDFQHQDVVRTATFTIQATPGAVTGTGDDPDEHGSTSPAH